MQAIGGHLFVTYVGRAPVNGNDAPTGGYVDEFDLDGRLVAQGREHGRAERAVGPGACADAASAGSAATCSSATSATGASTPIRRTGDGWAHDGVLRGAGSKPIVVNGLWGIGFGNGGGAGPRDTLFFASGPHDWRGATELACTACSGSISAR